MEKQNKFQLIVEGSNQIRFYSEQNQNGVFSNFFPAEIQLKNKKWPTTEHYYQAQKFAETEKEEKIRICKTPNEAFRLGRKKKDSSVIRSDWNEIKDLIMYEALQAKFTQHEDLKEFLLSTQDYEIIETTKRDNYWADGGDGSGKNMLGKLLMKLRDELRKQI